MNQLHKTGTELRHERERRMFGLTTEDLDQVIKDNVGHERKHRYTSLVEMAYCWCSDVQELVDMQSLDLARKKVNAIKYVLQKQIEK